MHGLKLSIYNFNSKQLVKELLDFDIMFSTETSELTINTRMDSFEYYNAEIKEIADNCVTIFCDTLFGNIYYKHKIVVRMH